MSPGPCAHRVLFSLFTDRITEKNSMKLRTRLAAAVVASAALAGLVAPTATAAPAGNIVTFGDSFSANPDQWRNLVKDIPGINLDYPSKEGCLQAPDSWPHKVAAKGFSVADWSCAGQTSRTMLGRLDRAVATGDLHEGTRAVVLPSGMNNFAGLGALDGVNVIDPNAVRRAYLADITEAAAKVRSVAPDAKIVIPGSLAAADPDTTMYCAVNVIPNAPMGLPVPLLRDAERMNANNQATAAKAVGATFVDIRSGSRNHNTCAPDQSRYVAGIIDTTTPNYNMSFHPSEAGSQYMADRIAPVL